mgnify:CR=1 FL=1
MFMKHLVASFVVPIGSLMTEYNAFYILAFSDFKKRFQERKKNLRNNFCSVFYVL